MKLRRISTGIFSVVLLAGTPAVSAAEGGSGLSVEPQSAPSSTAADSEQPALEQEEEGEAAELPPGIPALPGPRERDRQQFINKDNLDAFRPLLLSPIAAWIESGLVAVRAVRKLDFPWRMSEQWRDESLENVGHFRLDERGTLSAVNQSEDDLSDGGYPFGFARHIQEEGDPKRRAQMVLWNVSYALAAARDVLYEGELAWVGAQTLLRRSDGIFYSRSYLRPFRAPAPVPLVSQAEAGQEKKSDSSSKPAEAETEVPPPLTFSGPGDLFGQQLLQLVSPPVVYGYSQVGWRFRGPEEDLLWLYSPVIAKARQVLSSNRSDPLLGGIMTLDDLLVWGQKVQAVDATVLDEKTLLVPFPALTYYLMEQAERSAAPGAKLFGEVSAAEVQAAHAGSGGTPLPSVRGYYQRLDGSHTMTLWNHENRGVAKFAPWVPTSVTFVPREVWILELLPRDPYYLTGREILVVDKKAMLPVYKLVYDQQGVFQRLVMGGWGLARNKDGSARFPFAGFVLAVQAGAEEAMTFTPQAVRLIPRDGGEVSRELEALFEIQNHGKAEEPAKQSALPEQPAPSSLAPVETQPVTKPPVATPVVPTPRPSGTTPAPARVVPKSPEIQTDF
ncbi:MAG: DUF1329 domain-containing protein [Bdellovibrionales bacterium]|nr:DUF1329 domain-containing protein [Bdellovibrionales bacterium]